MAEPKPAREAEARATMFVSNLTDTPIVIIDPAPAMARHVKTWMLFPQRISPIPGAVWAGWLDTWFGKRMKEVGAFEVVPREQYEAQPKRDWEIADEEEEAGRAAAMASRARVY